jgi:hypothetical protein
MNVLPEPTPRIILQIRLSDFNGNEMGRQSVVIDTDGKTETMLRPDLHYYDATGVRCPAFIQLDVKADLL